VARSTQSKRTDPELVAMCLNGDASAWETLIKRYRRVIYGIPVKFGFEPADAKDVFQTVCLRLIEHLHELRINGSWEDGWLR
jgi:DNA-directed RNA polymerase specialized sigma24 family protein